MKQEEAGWIPNLNIGRDYDEKFADADIHYDSLTSLASFFGRNMSVHRHAEHVQIHFINSGNTHFHIDDRVYHVHGPTLFLTPAATPHSFSTEQNVTGHVLTIHQSTVWQLLSVAQQEGEALHFKLGCCVSRAKIPDEQLLMWDQIEQIWQNIETEWQSGYANSHLVLRNYVSLLLIYIGRLSVQSNQSNDVIHDDIRLFNRFYDEIEKHYKEGWTVQEYAKKIGVSESRLNMVCQRVSQASPKQVISGRRLQEIKRLLIFTTLSVNEIAYESGFTDPSYFSRFFKNSMSVSPLEYRKQQLKK